MQSKRTARSNEIRYILVASLVFVVGIAIRFAPRHWTPLPFNPDGFRFAAQAEHAAATGRIALESIGSHGLSFPVLLSQLELITDVSALSLTQPTIAVIGTIPCLFAFTFGRRIAYQRGWSRQQVLTAATIAGLVLATEGLYLRRTAAVSYEVLGILLVVVSAYSFHRLLATNRILWFLVLVPSLVALPITHHLSTIMCALTLTALAVAHVRRDLSTATVTHVLGILPVFWIYFAAYYILTQPPYFDQVATKPGLFLGWVIVLGGLVILFQSASSRAIRLTFALPFVGGFTILLINAVTDVFPGTAATSSTLLLFVAPLSVIVALAIWGVPLVIDSTDTGLVVLALFLAPVVFVWFSLTAGLSPEYRDFVARGQTFVHLSVMVMAAMAVVSLGWRPWPRLQPMLKSVVPALLLICALLSIPIAFFGPPVIPYESTTTTGQFQAVTFADAHFAGEWTSDDHLTRVGYEYYSSGVSPEPTYEWLHGAEPPDCPVLVQDHWSSIGVQAFPANQIPVDAHDLNPFLSTQQILYDGGGGDYVLVSPVDGSGNCS